MAVRFKSAFSRICNIFSEAVAFSIEVSPQFEMLLPDGPSVDFTEYPTSCPENMTANHYP
jgi:hypothetical protein